jgi:hypothetical protein
VFFVDELPLKPMTDLPTMSITLIKNNKESENYSLVSMTPTKSNLQ